MAVTTLEIIERNPLLGGKRFGSAGSYEVVKGRLTFAADPTQPRNRSITDIDKAPRTAAGPVEWWADFCLLQPADPARANRRLLFEVVNRGRILAFRLFDAVTETPDLTRDEYVGEGFLLQQGYTVAWCGWQWDVVRSAGLLGTEVPQAMVGNAPVSGKVLCQWWPNAATPVLLLADRVHHPYPAADLADAEATLAVRDHENASRQEIPRHHWQFARLEGGKVVADPTRIYLASGFEPGKIYECVYRTSRAPVVGLGLLAVRDTVSFLRYASPHAGNPATGQLEYAYGFGASQSGRFLRHLLYLNLNQDEAGRMVFDGVVPHIAGARRGEFNLRFGQPSANTLQGPNNVFPFTDDDQMDPVTGQTDGLLRRISQEGALPKILYMNSSAEYWRGDASLGHISVDGKTDAALPDGVRNYLMAGTQHTPGVLPLKDTAADGGRGQHPLNSVDYAPLLRAALVNLDRWVSHNESPPRSRYPRLADGTAAPAPRLAPVFQAIPGAAFPVQHFQPHRLDFGPEWSRGVAAGLPPQVGAPYVTFVPAVDQDGNEVAGIRLPDLTVPLATYTGWNPRHPEQGAPDQSLRMLGSTLPFPSTARARQQSGDPRPSIEERYASKAAYLELVKKAAEGLIAERFLLSEDLKAIVQRAAQRYDLFTGQR
ncbi:MAG: alpha/beta hydrolase domain-containing protein [Candidatus Entotheonellia bacterium]